MKNFLNQIMRRSFTGEDRMMVGEGGSLLDAILVAAP